VRGKKQPHRETFAEVLAEHEREPRAPAPQPVPIHSLLDVDEFVDDEGVTWTRRGGPISVRGLARMISDPTRRVLSGQEFKSADRRYLVVIREVC